jgi:hypothetical protein
MGALIRSFAAHPSCRVVRFARACRTTLLARSNGLCLFAALLCAYVEVRQLAVQWESNTHNVPTAGT